MRLLWKNLVDAAALTQVGSEIATLPGTNVQQPHLSRQWHTAAGVKASHLVFDFGAAVSFDTLSVLGTNLTAAATLRLRASNLDPNAVANLLLDTGTIGAGVKAGYGAAYKGFADPAARYARLDLADASVPDNLQIGRVVIGPSWTPSVPQEYGWSVQPLDESPVDESYGRQSYPDPRPKCRVLRFTLGWMDEAEMYANAFALARANGVVKDILAIHDLAGAYLSEQAVWGLLVNTEELTRASLKIFRTRFTVKERL